MRYYCADRGTFENSHFFFGITFTFRSTLTVRFLFVVDVVFPTLVTSLSLTPSVNTE